MASSNSTNQATNESNVIKFPNISTNRKVVLLPDDTLDEVFLKRLHSLPLIDQELWRESLLLACACINAGYEYELEVIKRRKHHF